MLIALYSHIPHRKSFLMASSNQHQQASLFVVLRVCPIHNSFNSNKKYFYCDISMVITKWEKFCRIPGEKTWGNVNCLGYQVYRGYLSLHCTRYIPGTWEQNCHARRDSQGKHWSLLIVHEVYAFHLASLKWLLSFVISWKIFLSSSFDHGCSHYFSHLGNCSLSGLTIDGRTMTRSK